MNPWPFVIAAYGLVVIATLGLIVVAALRMRRAERRLDQAKRG